MNQKRSLGQNFFVNRHLAEYIVDKVKDVDTDSIIEIGPGTGFFTNLLIPIFKNIVVIEKDNALAKDLILRFPNINVINSDFLDFDLDTLDSHKSTFFGSLPYNISKAIIRKITQSKRFEHKSHFIIQKEVAEKYLYAPPYSMLSLTTALYANCKKILDISKESFRPQPNVTSSLIQFSPERRYEKKQKELEKLISLSFKSPRKTLYNNLKNTDYKKGAKIFDPMRPAQLSLKEYYQVLIRSS